MKSKRRRLITLIALCLTAMALFFVVDFLTTGKTFGSNEAAAETPSDLEAPEILGDDQITIPRGSEFNPADYYTAEDNEDPNPTIEFSAVDTETIGIYPMNITATDATGNPRTRVVMVNVEESQADIKAREAEEQRIQEAARIAEAKEEERRQAEAAQKAEEQKKVEEQKQAEAKAEAEQKQAEAAEQTNETENQNQQAAETGGQQVTQTETRTETKQEAAKPAAQATIQPMQLEINGKFINYKNGGQGSGQAIIDADYGMASTWGGASVQSGSDGQNTHIIAHNPGAFDVLFSLGAGSTIRISDGAGNVTTYTVRNITRVDHEAYGVSDGADYWDQMIGTGGGERVTLQTCIDDVHNLVVFAYK